MVTHVKLAARLATLLLFLAFTSSALAQRTISGTVKDAANGSSIPGVNVALKGAKGVGTATSIDGTFSIKIPTGPQTLVFSFVGYTTQEVAITNQPKIDVLLQPSTQKIEEVVVTALGIKKTQKSLGYAFTELKGDDIKSSNTISPVDALAGKVSGVSIQATAGGATATSKITIRGNNSLRANNQPIFVVDGIIIENDVTNAGEYGTADYGNAMKNLNADDFESVSVLKGAAATALYGSKAMNGVVLIVTKKGQKGQGLGVDFSQTVDFTKAYASNWFQNIWGQGYPSGSIGYGDPFNTDQFYLTNGVADLRQMPKSYSFGPKMDGRAAIGFDGTMTTYSAKPHNYLDAFRTGKQLNTNVAISGASENSTYRLSLSRLQNNSITPRNDFDRYSVDSKLSHKFNDYITANLSANYTKSSVYNPPALGYGGGADERNLGRAFIYGQGIARNYDTKYWMQQQHYKGTQGGTPKTGDPNASVAGSATIWFNMFENTYKQDEDVFRGDLDFQVKLLPFLTFDLDGNIFNNYKTNEQKSLGTNAFNTNGYYTISNTRKLTSDFKGWVTFDKSFYDDFHATARLYAEQWNSETYYAYAATRDGLVVPGQYFIGNSRTSPAQGDGYITDTRRLNSLYFAGDFSYKSMLYLSLTARNDWSSTLTYADGSGNNSYFYPSASASWIFSETFKLPEWMTYGQFKLSYGEVGNDYSSYTINDRYSIVGTFAGTNYPMMGFTSNTVPNKNLKPERSKSWEAGLNLKFFNNRLGLDVSVYKNNTYDQILSVPVPEESGVTSQMINAGNIESKGIELVLNATPIKFRDFAWDVNLNWSKNQNLIKSLTPGVSEYQLPGGTYAIVGKSYGIFLSQYDYQYYQATDAQGNKVDNPSNGQKVMVWDDGTKSIIYANAYPEKREVGHMTPDWIGGVSNTFTYKGFSLSALINIKMGGDIESQSYQWGTATGDLKSTIFGRDADHGGITWTSSNGKTYHDGIIPEGVFADGTVINGHNLSGVSYKDAYSKGWVEPSHASAYYNNNYDWYPGGHTIGIESDRYLENSYVSLEQVTLSYSFPKKIAQAIKMRSLSLTAYGRNLWYIWQTLPYGMNPASVFNNQSGTATEYGMPPLVRTFGFTLNCGF
jgi:TonB-linked outer membrane protein, SusC/RagA family